MLSLRLRSKRPRMIVSISGARRIKMDYEPRTLEVYVTNKYAGSLQSKKNVVQGAASHHKKPVAKYYCHTKDWWRKYDQGLFDRKGMCKGCFGSVHKRCRTN